MLRLIKALIVMLAACGAAAGTSSRALPKQDPLRADALMADVRWFTDPVRQGRGSYQEGGRAAADAVALAFQRAGLEVHRQIINGRADNVFGILRGSDEAVIVSAHYDHLGIDEAGVMYPGADDNASGLAVLLGLARRAKQERFKRTLIFASFGAEEEGLIGSGVYIKAPLWPLAKTRALINFDLVGRRFFDAGVSRDGACAVVGLDEDPRAKVVADAAAAQHGLSLIAAPARLLELFGLHDRTDDWWFRRQGIVSVHFSTGFHKDYHQPTDTPDKVIPEQMSRIGRTAWALLVYFAN